MGIENVQNILNFSNAQSAGIKTEAGSDKVQKGETERKALQEKIEKKTAEIARKSDELKEASDSSGLEKFGRWLIGSDGGVSDLKADIERATADMKKAQEGLKVEQAKLEMELQGLQEAFGELGERTSQSQKTRDETDQNAAAAFA